MKPERGFIAERALAQHCPELLPPSPQSDELLAKSKTHGAPLALALAKALTPLLGGEKPAVEPGPASETQLADIIAAAPSLAAHCLLAVGKEHVPLLVMIEGAAILRLVDRAFGGKGAVPSPLPQEFPLSAELMIARLQAAAMAALADAWGMAWPGAVTSQGSSADLSAIAPFAEATPLAQQCFTIREAGGAQWVLTLVLPLDSLADLFRDGSQLPPLATEGRIQANPSDQPYGSLPLSLAAVLVDMALPVSVVSALTVGQVLPVSVARNVPLRIGGQTMAHGTIGALDERVAVQLIQAF